MKPKQSVKLIRIRNVSVISAPDQKYKKLKPPQAWIQFIKVTFYIDGLIEGDDSDESANESKNPKGKE